MKQLAGVEVRGQRSESGCQRLNLSLSLWERGGRGFSGVRPGSFFADPSMGSAMFFVCALKRTDENADPSRVGETGIAG
jgi:hypothetical protein